MPSELVSVTVTFDARDASLIERARGIWTIEHFVKAATLQVAAGLAAETTAKDRRGSVPFLPYYVSHIAARRS